MYFDKIFLFGSKSLLLGDTLPSIEGRLGLCYLYFLKAVELKNGFFSFGKLEGESGIIGGELRCGKSCESILMIAVLKLACLGLLLCFLSNKISEFFLIKFLFTGRSVVDSCFMASYCSSSFSSSSVRVNTLAYGDLSPSEYVAFLR